MGRMQRKVRLFNVAKMQRIQKRMIETLRSRYSFFTYSANARTISSGGKWHDEVLFPLEAAQSNLRHICDAGSEVWRTGMCRGLWMPVYLVDNNQYAFQFDDEVYHYFTEYVLNQDCDRLQWGCRTDRPPCGSLEGGQEPPKEDRGRQT